MVSNMRRLASDHADLHNSELPPNFLFHDSIINLSTADDLTQLTILLTGPQGTPYSAGLWRLHLKIPEDYPKSPPKAAFKTRIWHPNVEESTGAVCVDTLKRDWEPTLTLRDILITISCLLIHPNPDSALNSAAGALLQDDYDAFARHAKLMTSIHAAIPPDMQSVVMEAKRRGEDANAIVRMDEQFKVPLARPATRIASVVMKPKNNQTGSLPYSNEAPSEPLEKENELLECDLPEEDEEEYDDPSTSSKENDPSLSPSPVVFPPPSPRKTNSGKHPLSVLATPLDADTVMADSDDYPFDGMTASEKNIAANGGSRSPRRQSSPQRKSAKAVDFSQKIGILNNWKSDTKSLFGYSAQDPNTSTTPSDYTIFEDACDSKDRVTTSTTGSLFSKTPRSQANSLTASSSSPFTSSSSFNSSGSLSLSSVRLPPNKVTKPHARKVPSMGTNAHRTKPRVGLRRL